MSGDEIADAQHVATRFPDAPIMRIYETRKRDTGLYFVGNALVVSRRHCDTSERGSRRLIRALRARASGSG
jgi:hypothetical protein